MNAIASRSLVLLLLAALVLPSVTAVDYPDAVQVWQEEQGNDNLQAVRVEPGIVRDPSAWSYGFQFRDAPQNLTYQICNVGNVCYRVGIPMERVLEDGQEWWFAKAEHVNLPKGTLRTGDLLGVQLYFEQGPDANLTAFPKGLDFEDPLRMEDFKAWESTHYVTTRVDVAADRGAPALPLLGLLAALALASRMGGRR